MISYDQLKQSLFSSTPSKSQPAQKQPNLLQQAGNALAPIGNKIATGITNLQKFITQPNIPSIKVQSKGTIPLPKAVVKTLSPLQQPITAAQKGSEALLSGIANIPKAAADEAAHFATDAGRIIGSGVGTYPTAPKYSDLQSGVGKLSYNIASKLSPERVPEKQLNIKNTPQEIAGNIGQAAGPYAPFASGIGLGRVPLNTGPINAAAPGLLKTVAKGAASLAPQGFSTGFLEGLNKYRNEQELKDQIIKSTKDGIISAAQFAALGGTLAGGKYIVNTQTAKKTLAYLNSPAGQKGGIDFNAEVGGTDTKAQQDVIDKFKQVGRKGLTLDEKKVLNSIPIERAREMAAGVPEHTFENADKQAFLKNHPELAGDQPPTTEPPANEPANPVQKVLDALKTTTPLRSKQEASYTEERIKRLDTAQQAFDAAGGGQAGFEAKKAALAGELAQKQKFGGIGSEITPDDINQLHDMISTSNLSGYDQIAAGNGLEKLFNGDVPTNSELKLLNGVYGQDFTETALKHRSTLKKVTSFVADVLNVPRAISTSFDVSAAGRQGIVPIARNPKEAASAFVNQFKYFASQGAFDKSVAEIQGRPSYQKMIDSGLQLTETSGSLTGKEEAFQSGLAERIPIVGKMVQASERAYTGFLNQFRADLFDKMVASGEDLGKADNPKYLKDAASFINNATGRGDLSAIGGKNLQSAAPLLNGAFFSPRLLAARINLAANPVYYAKLDPAVRKEAAKTMASFVTTGLAIMGAAGLAGAKVWSDPRSADFGKIKVGDTRYSVWGGFEQYPRIVAQLISGKTINSTTGKVYSLGAGYKPTTRADILKRFFENKLAPVPSFLNDVARGSDAIGQKLNFTTKAPNKNTLLQRVTPLFVQDTLDAIDEYGVGDGILRGLPGLFGIGVQTYNGKKTPQSSTQAPSSIPTRIGL